MPKTQSHGMTPVDAIELHSAMAPLKDTPMNVVPKSQLSGQHAKNFIDVGTRYQPLLTHDVGVQSLSTSDFHNLQEVIIHSPSTTENERGVEKDEKVPVANTQAADILTCTGNWLPNWLTFLYHSHSRSLPSFSQHKLKFHFNRSKQDELAFLFLHRSTMVLG